MSSRSSQANIAIMLQEDYGFVFVPCSRGTEGKGTIIKYKKYEKIKPTVSEIEEWFSNDLDLMPNLGLVCGQNSGVAVLDIDEVGAFRQQGYEIPDDTPLVQTPSGGYHCYFRYPKGELLGIKNHSKSDDKTGKEIFSIRANNYLVMTPPSKNFKTNKRYRWAEGRTIYDIPTPDLPECFLKLVQRGKSNESKTERPATIEAIELKSEQHDHAVELLLPYWKEGQRFYLTGYLSGYLVTEGFSFNPAVRLITDLAERNNDEELNDRITCIQSTYQKYETEGAASIKGWSGLKDYVSPPDLEKLKDILKPRRPQSNSKMKALTVQDILSTDVDVTRFICKLFATRGCVTLVSGAPGAGKSFLMLSFANAVTTGSHFLGHFDTLKGRVAYFDDENSLETLKERLREMKISNPDISVYSFSNTNVIKDFKDFISVAKEHDVLIFDSLVHFHDHQENNAQEMSQVMDSFKKLADECDCSIILIHQQRKPAQNETSSDLASIRGSQQITYDSDMVFTITEEIGLGKIIMCQKSRIFRKPNDIIYDMLNTGNGMECVYISERQEEGDTKLETAKSLIPFVLRSYDATSEDNPMTIEDIDKHFKAQFVVVGTTNLRRALNELVADDKSGVKVITGSNNRKLYYIVDTETP